jgi:translation initiation factor IF-1
LEARTKESGIGTIEEVLPSALFRVRLSDGRNVVAGMAPSLRHVVVRLISGSKVRVELSSRDPNRAQIVEKL